MKEEIELVAKMISHPFNFKINSLDDRLSVGGIPNSYYWEVNSTIYSDSNNIDQKYWRSFASAIEAASFFCEQLHKFHLLDK